MAVIDGAGFTDQLEDAGAAAQARPRWLRLVAMLFCFALVLQVFPGSATAQARDLIAERSYYEDTSRTLSYEDVQTRPTTPFSGVLSKGFGESVVWVRLRLSATPDRPAFAPDQIALRVRPTFLDDVRLFDPLAGGLVGAAGDRAPWGSADLRTASYVFVIAAPAESRDVWLRVQTTSTRNIAIDAVNAADLVETEGLRTLIIGAYLGIILFMLLWSFILWIKGREKVISAFLLKQVIACFFGLSVLGWLRLALPGSTPLWIIDHATSVLGLLAVTSSLWFEIAFTSEFDPPAWSKRLFHVLLLLLPVELVLIAAGHISLALTINMAQVLLLPPLVLLAVVLSRGWRVENPEARPALPRWLVIGNYLILVAVLAMAGAIGLGLTGGYETSIYISLAYGLVTGLLILLLLQYRTTVMARRQVALTSHLLHAQSESDRERQQRIENEKLLAIIAHEMRTPMSSLRLITGLKAPTADAIAQAQQAVREMNDIIDRCAQAEQLESRRISAMASTFSMRAVIESITARVVWRADIRCDAAELPDVQSDEQVLRIILCNMVDNACKYGAPDQPIEISVRVARKADRDGIEVSIANQPGAAGWPDPSRMFEKYYRSPSSRGITGSGLGLYLVANLAQILEGGVTYEPDQSLIRFVLWFPQDISA